MKRVYVNETGALLPLCEYTAGPFKQRYGRHGQSLSAEQRNPFPESGLRGRRDQLCGFSAATVRFRLC
jgi:hypothetical protein